MGKQCIIKGREVVRGIVKWFSKDKGFGFIVPNDGGQDIFVHYNDILGDESFKVLVDGQHVEYDSEVGVKGPKAKNVKVVPKD